ncbi:hypothetical protein GCM10009536_28280 [Streptomyces thermocarboxydus]
MQQSQAGATARGFTGAPFGGREAFGGTVDTDDDRRLHDMHLSFGAVPRLRPASPGRRRAGRGQRVPNRVRQARRAAAGTRPEGDIPDIRAVRPCSPCPRGPGIPAAIPEAGINRSRRGPVPAGGTRMSQEVQR